MADPTRTVSSPDDPPVTRSIADGTATGGDANTSPPVAPPTAVGRYVLGAEIARGGMGVVYRAADTALGREVAVKVLSDKYPANSPTARRFHDEARIAAQLQHPGIPPVHDLGTLPDGRPFLAMKLIKGDTLDALLGGRAKGQPETEGAGGHRPSVQAGRWLAAFEKVCEAVAYAHAHAVIHRDLKPGNVMVGAFGEVQVMDWGLAKVLASRDRHGADDPDATAPGTVVQSLRDSDGSETQAGRVLGTPAFMPPEQAVGAEGKIDTRSDVFGVGAILAVILTGQPPFAANSTETTRVKAAQGDVADCFARLDGCGAEPDLVSLAKRCLSPKPNGRPTDAGEVARAVAGLRSAADERARRAEIDRERAEVESREQRKRRRVVQWGAGAVAGVLLLGLGGTAAGLIAARAHEAEATKQAGLARDEARAKETAHAAEKQQRDLAELRQRQAEVAKEREGTQRAKAEKARDRSTDVLDAMTSDLTGELLTRQGDLSEQQRRFLAQALAYYKEFAGETADDLAVLPRVAAAALRVARIEARLGRVSEAADAYTTAADRYQRLAADRPDRPEYRVARAAAHAGLGWALEVLNRRADAEKQFRNALEVA